MKRKVIAFLLACSMVSAMVGCGSKETKESTEQQSTEKQDSSVAEESTAIGESDGITFPLAEPIEIDVFSCVGNEPYYLQDTFIMKYMEEKTNVKLNVTNVSGDELEEKKNILLNSGDYPDVFLKAGVGDGYKYGSEGIFIDMTDLLKQYAPNYCSILDAEDAWPATMASDGKIYSLVEFNRNYLSGQFLNINQKWLDNLGLKMPTSAEEFYEVLKAFKEQDADGDGDPNNEIPLVFGSADIIPVECLWNYFGIDHQGWGSRIQLTDDKKLCFFPASEDYKEILAYTTKLYKEGLINQDCFTLTAEQQRAMGQTGTAIGAFFDWGSYNTIGQYEKGVNEKGLEYTYVMPFEKEGGKMYNSKGYVKGVFAITDKCEYPEIMVAWIDYLYSHEGTMISTYGHEGEQYQIIDGAVQYIGDWNVDTIKPYLLQLGGVTQKPANNLDIPQLYFDKTEKPLNAQKDEFAAKLLENDLYFDIWPTLVFTEDETVEKDTIMADIDAYFLTYRAQVITGELDLEASWDNYIKTMEDMGVRKMEAIYNAAYERATN